jgi:hypothetical protein
VDEEGIRRKERRRVSLQMQQHNNDCRQVAQITGTEASLSRAPSVGLLLIAVIIHHHFCFFFLSIAGAKGKGRR